MPRIPLCWSVLGEQEVHFDFADDDQAHVGQPVRLAIRRHFVAIHMDLVLAQVLDKESMLLEVPADLRVLLADGVLLCEAEVVRVVDALLPANVDFERTVFLDEELAVVLSHNFGECRLASLAS